MKESLTVRYGLVAVPLVSGIGPGVDMFLKLGDSLAAQLRVRLMKTFRDHAHLYLRPSRLFNLPSLLEKLTSG